MLSRRRELNTVLSSYVILQTFSLALALTPSYKTYACKYLHLCPTLLPKFNSTHFKNLQYSICFIACVSGWNFFRNYSQRNHSPCTPLSQRQLYLLIQKICVRQMHCPTPLRSLFSPNSSQ